MRQFVSIGRYYSGKYLCLYFYCILGSIKTYAGVNRSIFKLQSIQIKERCTLVTHHPHFKRIPQNFSALSQSAFIILDLFDCFNLKFNIFKFLNYYKNMQIPNINSIRRGCFVLYDVLLYELHPYFVRDIMYLPTK